MAKHFRQDADKTTKRSAAVAPQSAKGSTRRVAPVVNAPSRRGNTDGHLSMPYGEPAAYRYSYPAAARHDDIYLENDEGFARGGIHRLGRGFFLLLAIVVRLMALVLFVIVILNAMPIPPITHYVAAVTQLVTDALPWHDMKILAVDTPFGGSFRCDLCLLSLALFVFDWLFCRLRAALV
ncbi:MAG: hypothetical protein IKG21_07370 [Atopobiaceae bacterium]|nr:hypothetical protein [Atopobiaceae bacterium]